MMHMRRTLGGIQRLGRPILDFGTEPRFGNIDTRPTRALFRRRIPSMRQSAESPHVRQGRREGNSPFLPVARGPFVEPNGRGGWLPPNGVSRLFLPCAHSSPRQHPCTPCATSDALHRRSLSGGSQLDPGRECAQPPYRRPTHRRRRPGRGVGARSQTPPHDALHAELYAAAIATPENAYRPKGIPGPHLHPSF